MTDEDTGNGGHDTGRKEFHEDPIGHADAWAGMSVGDLATEYRKAGIGAAEMGRAVDIYAEMLDRDDVTNFFGLAGAMVPGGMRSVVSDLIRDGHIDALVTTGATLTHDAIEAVGGKHHHGRTAETGHERDHDEQLRDEGVDRIYNVYLPQEHFTLFEGHLRDRVFPEFDGVVATSEFTRELGRANLAANDGVDEDAGIAAAAYKHDVPVFVPAIQDSVLGIQAWMHSQVSAFTLDALADLTNITDVAFDAEKAGATVVGGGVPKNFTLQTMLTVPEAYDYGVQLTTDPASTGGLSGATLDEARSWGKLEKSAKNVTVLGDATITFPLLVAGARDRL
ncbi:MAG: deoxyhypusine synthase [Haloplanus sp.]